MIPWSPRRCSTLCRRMLGRRVQCHTISPLRRRWRRPRRRRRAEGPKIFLTRAFRSFSLADMAIRAWIGGSRTSPRGADEHISGRFSAPGAAGVVKFNVLMYSGSGIAAMSEKLVETLRAPLGVMQIALTRAFVGHARVVTSLEEKCDIDTLWCPFHLRIGTPWGAVRFTLPFIVLPEEMMLWILGRKS